jgi:hypothetical protein
MKKNVKKVNKIKKNRKDFRKIKNDNNFEWKEEAEFY